MKVSVIDLGFNSVKMVNYNVNKDGSFKAYQNEGVKVRLGEGMDKTGYLGREPIERTIEALKLFRDVINFDSIKHVLPVATSAVRDAGNREHFLEQAYRKTGFQFKVLTGQEEAFYSYVGALESICVPTSLFFDLGGGSLELVYSENHSIKKIKSYPLGALRLSQMFGNRGTFSKKDYNKMIDHILDTLPYKKELSLSIDTTLVGVGGTLRALARYNQELVGYELDKIHNYRMDYQSVSSLSRRLARMDVEELADIKAVGSNRLDTIIPGSAIIASLMQALEFDKIVVSARGLREGIMSVFARDPKTYYNGSMNGEKARTFVAFACKQEMLPRYTFMLVKPLVAAGLMREKEKTILIHAINQMSDLPILTNLNNLFHIMMDDDNAFLTHREQLILSLSILYNKKEKAVDWLFSRYKSILEPQNMKSIRKIAACLALSAILERTRSEVKLAITDKKITIKITAARKSVMPALLASTLKNFEQAFDVAVSYHIMDRAGNGKSKIKVIV
ncbi:MAG: hypothetical protein DA330_00060 [Nitrososphaera sp.]|nr:hypothetical protein [Nitrososphaera sp.]